MKKHALKNICASMLALLMMNSVAALPVSASQADDLQKQIEEMEMMSAMGMINPIWTPIKPQTGVFVESLEWGDYLGVLVSCTDIADIEGETYDGYVLSALTGEAFQERYPDPPKQAIMFRTLEAERESWETYRYTFHPENVEIALPEEYADRADEVYIVDAFPQTGSAYILAQLFTTDERFTVLGFATMRFLQYGDYCGYIIVTAQENCTVDWNALAAESSMIGQIEFAEDNHAAYMLTPDLPQADAAAFCQELEARDDIASAYLTGSYPLPSAGQYATAMQIIPLKHYGSGDFNANGTLDLTDAVLLARATGGAYQLSAEARAEADLNADGEVDQADLMLLLQKLAGL